MATAESRGTHEAKKGRRNHKAEENSTESDSDVWDTEGIPTENVLTIYVRRLIKRIFRRSAKQSSKSKAKAQLL